MLATYKKYNPLMCFYFQYFKATPGVADLMGARVGYLKRGSDVYNEVVNQVVCGQGV